MKLPIAASDHLLFQRDRYILALDVLNGPSGKLMGYLFELISFSASKWIVFLFIVTYDFHHWVEVASAHASKYQTSRIFEWAWRHSWTNSILLVVYETCPVCNDSAVKITGWIGSIKPNLGVKIGWG